ncbi:MAG: flagella basal body P-ring formation protein FlgA [Alphaproteobacteria bacterium]|nr:MAG: flagella basal body P-ring formation protein FlgA [Alphaproteobacteria bacterium]
MHRVLTPLWHAYLNTLALALAALMSLSAAGKAADVGELVAERAEAEFGVQMPANGRFDVRLARDLPTQGEFIRDFWIDRKSGQFIANLVLASGDETRIWGVAQLNVSVPVPARRLMPDEIISEADINVVEMPWQRVNAFAVLEAKDLIGKQVRRMLPQGRPVLVQSVSPPLVITRGQKVQIEFRRGGLYLAAEGKAITDAFSGQEVRVVNLSSNRIIVGIATDDGKVDAKF